MSIQHYGSLGDCLCRNLPLDLNVTSSFILFSGGKKDTIHGEATGKAGGGDHRTLHYYDQVGLLRPAAHGENGCRYYDESAVLRLQQILFCRELDFPLYRMDQFVFIPYDCDCHVSLRAVGLRAAFL